MRFGGIKIWLRVIIISTIGLSFLFNPVVASADALSDLLRKIDSINQEMMQKKQELDNKKNQAKQLSGEIGNLDRQISDAQSKLNQTQEQIDSTQNDIDQTQGQIDQKEQELQKERENLQGTLIVMYETVNQDPIQMILASNSLSELFDQNEYLEVLEGRIQETMDKINAIKTDLENTKSDLERKKGDLERLKKQQIEAERQFEAQKSFKNSLLTETKGDQAEYEKKLKLLEKDKAQISAEVYELRRRLGNDFGERYGGGGSGYPFGAIDEPDPWGFLTRECTSYAAWKWNVIYGKRWINTRPGQGSAWNWPTLAYDQGYSVNASPQVGAIVSWPAGILGAWGHVAIVEGVNANGTINVSEYNWVRYSYSERYNVPYWNYGNASFIY